MAWTRPALSSAAMMARAETGPIPETEIKFKRAFLFFGLQNHKEDGHLHGPLGAGRLAPLDSFCQSRHKDWPHARDSLFQLFQPQCICGDFRQNSFNVFVHNLPFIVCLIFAPIP